MKWIKYVHVLDFRLVWTGLAYAILVMILHVYFIKMKMTWLTIGIKFGFSIQKLKELLKELSDNFSLVQLGMSRIRNIP